jgi:hypothetical protein
MVALCQDHVHIRAKRLEKRAIRGPLLATAQLGRTLRVSRGFRSSGRHGLLPDAATQVPACRRQMFELLTDQLGIEELSVNDPRLGR